MLHTNETPVLSGPGAARPQRMKTTLEWVETCVWGPESVVGAGGGRSGRESSIPRALDQH